jgi:ribosomal protein S18 acetylase RimI-like enzyme
VTRGDDISGNDREVNDALEIRPLTAETFDALGELFGEGGDPRWCWCAFWRTRGAAGGRKDADANRELLHGLAQRVDGPAAGLVALRDERVVGWVSLGPRQSYDRLTSSKVLAPLDDTPVWSIVCFVVSRPERGHGIGRRLLDAAIDYARQHGATVLEAYPAETDGGRIPAASANGGTVPMFERAGFSVVARRQANPSAQSRPIMRLELT